MNIKKGDILFDLYSVEEDAVETGSSSLVWKVHHIKWDTYMALKQPKENVIAENGGKENFLRECEMWVSLGFHPHIVPCYYVREIDGKPTMFSEWCDGGNLAENIKEGTLYKGTVKEQEQRIISIALQILLGLRYAHSKKVIHKDIKPANIMLTSEGVARITDFGSAGSQNETATITYRSPEQTPYDNGETVTLSQEITEKTDIYSWALTVLNMCAGFVYWEKGNEAEKYYHNYLTEFSVVINPMFKDLLFRCLAASPEQRPCADELIQSMRILFGEMLSDDIAMNYIDTEEIGGDADSLNNMALSYIDLKEYEKADKCWRKALSVSPFHPESTYNYNVYLWAMGRISNVTLRRQTEILSSERKELFLGEIDRYADTKFLKSFSCSKTKAEEDEQADFIDCVRFSEDGKKILSSSQYGDYHIVWDVETGKALKIMPYSDNPEKKTKEKWCKPILVSSDRELEFDDDISQAFSGVIQSRKNGRTLATINCTCTEPYSFSPDGSMLAAPDGFNELTLYSIPEEGVPRFAQCRFLPPDVLLENKRKYEKKRDELFLAVGYMDYKNAVELINEMCKIPVYGSMAECRHYKAALFPVCKKSGCRAIPVQFFPYGISDAQFSPDGKTFVTVGFKNMYVPEDCFDIWRTGSARPFDRVHTPNNEEILDIWFEENGDISFAHGIYEMLFSDFYNLHYITEFDTKRGLIKGTTACPGGFTRKKTNIPLPEELEKFCEDHKYDISRINSDCTVMLAGTEHEFAVFEIDYDIEYDEEKAEELHGHIILNRVEYSEEEGEKVEFESCFDLDDDIIEEATFAPTSEKKQGYPLFPEKEDIKIKPEAETLPDAESMDAEERRSKFLPKLAQNIRNMRACLSDVVFGQDHAVHAFCDGVFDSQVLSHSDTERVRPRAVFTFAGPPGVGKTFLAEQAAKYLGKPFKRFDMTEYTSNDSHLGLIGFESTWRDAAPGQLTSFVRENPDCVLLFDEIEKAHPQVIQVFFQMLDAGVVTDKYHSTKYESATRKQNLFDGKVSFKDAIIIFTTNAGRSLYEGDYSDNCAGVSEKTLLNALKTEVNPLTKAPYFPSAIISRISTGYPVLFNNMKPHFLQKIIEKEIEKVKSLFEKQYGITINVDKNVITSLLFSQGGKPDARSLRARVELFFKNEFLGIFSSGVPNISDIVKYNFTAETQNLPENIKRLFHNSSKPEILVYSNRGFARCCTEKLEDFVFHTTQSMEEALKIAGEKDISFAVIDLSQRNADNKDSIYSDDNTVLTSMAATSWKDGKKLFKALRDRIPELPLYLLESTTPFSEELVTSFVRAGARGKLTEPDVYGYKDFGKRLEKICSELHMQSIASDIAAQRKVLCFETAPRITNDEVVVILRDYELKVAPDADDVDDILSEAEKPSERFDDVIGADRAKEKLRFYVDYLKNVKKYSAMGVPHPKGLLLHGRPGTGKTMLARAFAGEADVTFIHAAASSFVGQYAGSGTEAVRELFRKARRYAPSIIFIDEVDTIAKKRTGSEFSHNEEDALNAFLAEMDGFEVNEKRPVLVLAATNYGVKASDGIGILDEAFMRRFDNEILIEYPNTDERRQLIEVSLSKGGTHSVSEEMINSIASRSTGMSPATLVGVVKEARSDAFNKGKALDDALLVETFESKKHGAKKDWGEKFLTRTARHECGHAVINILSGNIPSYITIEARGNMGGYMEMSQEEKEAPEYTREELIWRIRTALGGRAAEIVCYGKDGGISTGASNDLRAATNIAKNMITCYGMDEVFGLAVMTDEEIIGSSELRKRVNCILAEQLEETIKLINENRTLFDKLFDGLMLKNRLTGEEISALINT